MTLIRNGKEAKLILDNDENGSYFGVHIPGYYIIVYRTIKELYESGWEIKE